MHVAVDQTRHRQAALEIDNSGARPDVGAHFVTAARGEKPPVDDGDSFDQRTEALLWAWFCRWLTGPNLPVEQNQVGTARQLAC